MVLRRERSGEETRLSPPGVAVGSRVHEYGGAAARASGGSLVYVDRSDQRLYRMERAGSPARPLSVPPEPGSDLRYADPRLTRSGRWLVAVEERHRSGSTGHRLVAVASDGSLRVLPLVDTSDFVASPRISPNGTLLAWVGWDHPSMPWDSSVLWLARLHEDDGAPRVTEVRRVAGGEGSSVGQPLWCRDGGLVFVWDRTGWWLPHRMPPDGGSAGSAGSTVSALVEFEAEFHGPDWVLGQATLAERPDGSLVARMHRDGRDHLVRLDPGPGHRLTGSAPKSAPWSLEVLAQPCVSISGVAVTDDGRTAVLGSTPSQGPTVLEVPAEGGSPAACAPAPSRGRRPDPGATGAIPWDVEVGGRAIPGLFHPPVAGHPGDGPPPLVVFCHGGPTGACDPGFDPVIRFFTGSGLAVACVDYRGSTGYGRSYRRSLAGRWGEADVEDCTDYAVALAEGGVVDGYRMAIRGTSAGGFTALAALVDSDRFAGAVSWYGVTDLEHLAAETHDFESRYLDGLVGPLPDAAPRYRRRSPIHRPGSIAGAVLLLQGADDPVVPVGQAERFAERLAAEGVPCDLLVFPGEGHGFRRAATLETCLEAELSFYRRLFDRGEPAAPDAGAAG